MRINAAFSKFLTLNDFVQEIIRCHAEFPRVFSPLEMTKCDFDQRDKLLTLLDHLPKWILQQIIVYTV